ncbi:hypothetical protein DW1_1107 [Proteiniborus sp. DW1]|uniref:hypothetical protein n=1 Tax=Proteiniborus sp. DW1 TaxID=1889883 RepID=UPI00092E09D1|nr:hypothetical protein [Proteiniborus sp. DW1]SCG82680.1 hypothetical protein DW1_1107 [Proteiniborus sp. DW1]
MVTHYKNTEKCFANNSDCYCSALKIASFHVDICKDCSFFKTQKQVEEGREKAIKRVESLDAITRQSIYDKYFK